jgi:SAM-dependent methyltransferase
VFGSRFAASPERRVLLYWHSLGNKILTWLTNMLNDLNLTDMETGYKAIRADVLKSLRLQSERFGIEPEMTTRLAQWGARIYEVPISYDGRTYAEGKNIGWRDGVQAIWLLLKYNWFDTRFSDRYGHATLESMAVSQAVSRWQLEPMSRHLGDRVLEAGAGNGNLTRHLLEKERLVAVEIDPFYTRSLDRRWGHLINVSVVEGDLEEPGLYEGLGDEGFDSVLCVNVLEHLDHPERALLGFARVLKPGGRAVILVPAHQWLFSRVDQVIEHRQRFEKGQLKGLLEAAGFEVPELFAFNRFGVLGWLFNKWTGHTTIRPWQTRMFSMLLPVARAVERIRKLPGLSWVAIAVKK